ncbi:MAG: glycosyltransferase, partial [Nitrospinota bacterium]
MDCTLDKKLTILIINYKTPDFLENCVGTLYRHSPAINFDILIVDNNSQDESIENLIGRFPKVHIIKNSRNLGFGTANNIAIRKILSQYILLLNSDTIILPKTLSSLLNTMEASPSTGILGGQLLHPDGTFQESYNRFPGLLNEFIRKNAQRE